MQIERQDGRAIADYYLGSQMIAIAQAMNGLNGESREIFFATEIAQRALIRGRAAHDYERQQNSAAPFHLLSLFFRGGFTITLIAVNLRSPSSLASTVTSVSISMSVALIGSFPL